MMNLASEPLDLLITDMHMPEHNGMTVVREARRLQPNIYTLIITGHTNRYSIEDLISDGTADIMFKPFHMNELRLALAKRRREQIEGLHQSRD